MRVLRVPPEAEEELAEAAEWYEAKRPGLGIELVAIVDFFRADEGAVEVIAVAHANRRPGYWLDRAQR